MNQRLEEVHEVPRSGLHHVVEVVEVPHVDRDPVGEPVAGHQLPAALDLDRRDGHRVDRDVAQPGEVAGGAAHATSAVDDPIPVGELGHLGHVPQELVVVRRLQVLEDVAEHGFVALGPRVVVLGDVVDRERLVDDGLRSVGHRCRRRVHRVRRLDVRPRVGCPARIDLEGLRRARRGGRWDLRVIRCCIRTQQLRCGTAPEDLRQEAHGARSTTGLADPDPRGTRGRAWQDGPMGRVMR